MSKFLKSILILTVVLMSLPVIIQAQEVVVTPEISHKVILKTQLFQFKDDFTYDLVYSGINLMIGYAYNKQSEKNTFSFASEIGFGANFNKGAGIAWRFRPVDISYGYKTGHKPLKIGGFLSADYQWQQYSELQGGRLFWFSTIEIGPRLIYMFPVNSKSIKATFTTSLAGLTSRPKPSTEQYFYNFSFSEFGKTAHKNLKAGFSNLFNHTTLELELLGRAEKRLSIAYEFEYLEYYDDPEIRFLNHSLNFKWKIGKL
jgi:hypothetical protein